MATPSFLTLRILSSAGQGVQPGSLRERILTCLAIYAARQNPDGSNN